LVGWSKTMAVDIFFLIQTNLVGWSKTQLTRDLD
jgi:hypothetical protein